MTELDAAALLPDEEVTDPYGDTATVDSNDADSVTLRYATFTLTVWHHLMREYQLNP